MIVLDTSILSAAFFKRRKSPAELEAVERLSAWIAGTERLAIPGIVFQELLSAPRDAHGVRAIHEALSGFPIVLADRQDHESAAAIRRACRDAGVAAATADSLIAAQSLARGRRLFTLDDDFTAIARVVGLRLV